MAESAEEFLFERHLDEIKEEIALLNDKIDSLTRALVETKASLITQSILSQILWKAVKPHPKTTVDKLTNPLSDSLSYLRGRLSEDAIPEDAFSDWYSDLRNRLSSILTPSELDSLLPVSSPWGKLLPFPMKE